MIVGGQSWKDSLIGSTEIYNTKTRTWRYGPGLPSWAKRSRVSSFTNCYNKDKKGN